MRHQTDSLGVYSTPVTWTGLVQAPLVVFNNDGNGQVQINWTGSSGAVTLAANQSYQINGTAAGLTVSLLTSGATYTLQTNGGIDAISTASGVTNVNVSVDTGIDYSSYPMWVGDGHVDNITLPGDSTVNVTARGDLWSLQGPSSNGTMTGLTARDLVFANLDGSILGVDSIALLNATGWLGTSASQEVEVAAGIGSLSAYGVGATVLADTRQDAGDPEMAVNVGDGGVTSEIDAGSVSDADIEGDTNQFYVNALAGPAALGNANNVTVNNTTDAATLMKLGNVGKLLFDGTAPETIPGIKSTGTIDTLEVKKGLTLQPDPKDPNAPGTIKADAINQIQIDNGDLKAEGIIGTMGIGEINVPKGSLILTTSLQASWINSIDVENDLTAYIIESAANGGDISVGGNFTGGVSAGSVPNKPPKGLIGEIWVGGDFLPGTGVNEYLVRGAANVESIEVLGDIGGAGGKPAGKIQASDIGSIESVAGSILLESIQSTNGDIASLMAPVGEMAAGVTAINGDINYVWANAVKGNLTARMAKGNPPFPGGSIIYVFSEAAIPNTVSIRADLYISKIKVENTAGVAEAFQVSAMAGAKFDNWVFDQIAPLVIDVGAGNYIGTMNFLASNLTFEAVKK